MKLKPEQLLFIIGKKDVELFHLQSQLVLALQENQTLKEEIKELTKDGNRSNT